MNRGLCNTCGTVATATAERRENEIYLVKKCGECGETATLISSDADRYERKASLGEDFSYQGCHINCDQCEHYSSPYMLFLDVTNRCNLNCPICMNNTPAMGFLFEPPMEYFVKIFEHFKTQEPKPVFQFFGGEPTVRENLLEMIDKARSYGYTVRLVTNGIKLTDPDYCREIAKRRVTFLLSYDGDNPEYYSGMRNSAKILDLKKKAIDTICSIPQAKLVLMTLVAKGINDETLPELFDYCHDRRDTIRGVYLMPLAHTWEADKYDTKHQRTTIEDVECIVDNQFPDEQIDFIPAGFAGRLEMLRKYFRVPPLPFVGAHPNCESVYFLISNGEKYLPVDRFLKGTILELAHDAVKVEKKFAALVEKTQAGWFGKLLEKFGVRERYLHFRAYIAPTGWVFRHVRLGRLLKGRGPMKILHALAIPLKIAVGKRPRDVVARHITGLRVLQLVVLPYEDRYNFEADRLERCPNSFAHYDPKTDTVSATPVCTWQIYKKETMRSIAEYYGTAEVKPK